MVYAKLTATTSPCPCPLPASIWSPRSKGRARKSCTALTRSRAACCSDMVAPKPSKPHAVSTPPTSAPSVAIVDVANTHQLIARTKMDTCGAAHNATRAIVGAWPRAHARERARARARRLPASVTRVDGVQTRTLGGSQE